MEIWQKIKNLYTGERKKLVWFITAWLIYFSWTWLFGSGNTLFVWLDAKRELREKTVQIKSLDERIEDMDREMNHRESNLDTLEKFARQQHQFAEPGEDVYIIAR